MRKPSKDLLNNLSKNLRYYRKYNELSQEELADTCGLHRTYIGSVERGERNVTLSTLETLANTLKITIFQLLED
mgnify:CR=1 FL=1